MRQFMVITALIALLVLAISPGVFANERYKQELVAEFLNDSGTLVRTYKVIDLETGHEAMRQELLVYGEEYADGKKTAYDLKMHLINRGDGDLLYLGSNTTVSEEVLRQWQEEGYDPVYEFGGSGSSNTEPEPTLEPEPEPQSEPQTQDSGTEPVIIAQPIESEGETIEPEPDFSEPVAEQNEPSEHVEEFAEEDLEPLEPPHLTDEMAEQLQQDFESNLSWWQRLLRWFASLWNALVSFIRGLAA